MESLDENGGSRLVVTELSHIKELVTQLEGHLGGSRDLCKHLASQIFSIIERSIGMITASDFGSGRKRSAVDAGLASATPRSPSDAPFKNAKKRKTTEKRKNQVRVRSAGGGEAPVEDGHSWRKYGQKEILGAKYPRGYYRCTHRHSRGCAATKQVQRTDEDPAVFDVFYLGAHTCVHGTQRNLTVKAEGLLAAAGEHAPFFSSSTPASVCPEPERGPFSAPSTTSDNPGALPATSDNSNLVASSFPPFQWQRAQSELHEVVSALVVASTPAALGTGNVADELLDVDDIDVSCFFA